MLAFFFLIVVLVYIIGRAADMIMKACNAKLYPRPSFHVEERPIEYYLNNLSDDIDEGV